MDRIELPREKIKPEFHFIGNAPTVRLIFSCKDLEIGYTHPLTKPLNLRMERGQRIALIGENGRGKTTLIKTILGYIPPLSGTIDLGQKIELAYFEQEDFSHKDLRPIEEIWDSYQSLSQAEVRSMLAKCGLSNENMESKIKVLSGGEQAKLRLCKIMNRSSNILILDEPTNHLDPYAKEELKRALKSYKGGIFLVSHDREFYEEIATDIWSMEDFSR